MTPFAVSFQDGRRLLGLGLSNEDIQRIKAGEHVIVDLGSVDVGLWGRGADGEGREFLQPRDSKIVLIAGDTKSEIGEFLKVDLK